MQSPSYIRSAKELPSSVSQIYIYGSGERGVEFMNQVKISRCDIDVLGFLDSSSSGEKMQLPKLKYSDHTIKIDIAIVICSYAQKEIMQMLIDNGHQEIFVYANGILQRQLNVNIAAVCDARCIFCQGRKLHSSSAKNYTMVEFEKVKPHIEHASEVCFCGGYGEPLLNKDFPKMLSYIKSIGKKTRVFTNGSPLERTAHNEELIQNVDSITFSFVSLDANIHKIYVGTSLERVMRNIRWVSEKPIQRFANVIVSRDNFFDLVRIYDFFGELGFKHVTFNLMRDYGNSAIKDLAIGKPSCQEIEAWKIQHNELMACYEKFSRMTNFKISNNLEAIFAEGTLKQKEQTQITAPQKERKTRLCIQPWQQWFINIHGHVKPCCGGLQPIGNIFTDDSIIGNAEHEAIKRSLLTGDLLEACKRCLIATECTTAELEYYLHTYGA